MASQGPAPARRFVVERPEGVEVSSRSDRSAPPAHHLPAGTVVVCAAVADEERSLRVRIASPAGWVDGDALAPASPSKPARLSREDFIAHHLEIAPGEQYGIPFPFSLRMIEEWGPDFLTEAFRAAGTIAADNAVRAIASITVCEGGQAADKAFLAVEYARAEPGLRRTLFVKVPSSDVERKFYLAETIPFEVAFARRSAEHDLPFAVPRYYYGDYATQTGNFILVTDCVPYGEQGIAPPCHKGYDHLLPDAEERYHILTSALASLAAAHKRGDLGLDVERDFPFPRNAPRSRPTPDLDRQLDRLLHFMADTAPHLFPAWTTRPEFLETFRADVAYGLANGEALARWLHSDVDAVGLCHPNLNLDNAWFWRDEAGRLQAGLLDWGMTRQMTYAQALAGMLMFPEPERYAVLVRDVIRRFVRELAEHEGPSLDEGRLRRQFQVSLFMSTIGMVLGIVVDQFDQFSKADYQTMTDRFDPRLLETGLCAGLIWVRNVLEEWGHETTPGDACRAALADLEARRAARVGAREPHSAK